ncbi:S9 family peptidase [uncultured Duncaniella sp.]|uniref:S9 family peptidase n=1 Tax=uncultured Duncaniella sp. TaxID=2768039 RepID=UPI0025A9CAE4|nr:S9 family peptidase [uncultured Duncaniella sp.]
MNIRALSLAGLATLWLGASAEKIDVTSFRYQGPFVVNHPVMVDSVDVNSKKFDRTSLLATPVSLATAKTGREITGDVVLGSNRDAIHLLNFSIDNERYVTATLKIDGLRHHEVYLDGKKLDGDKLTLTPATHNVTIKCLTDNSSADSLHVAIESEHPGLMKINSGVEKRRFTLNDVMTGKRFSSSTLSPSGKYLLRSYYYTHDGGANTFSFDICDFASGRVLAKRTKSLRWMPKSDRLYYTRYVDGKLQLVTVDPANGSETVIANDVPESYFTISPTEDFLIYTRQQEGPKEKNADLYEIIHPEDRQPGWRNRGTLMIYDFATGMSTPLTFGNRNTGLCGLSDDGRKLLYQVSESRLEKRPTTLTSLYLLDLSDNSVMTLVEKEGFFGGAILSPDGTKVALIGSPEAYGAVGRNLPEDRIPSMYDNQLYVLDVATKAITPLTRDFDPSVDNVKWNRNDGNIYFIASDRDRRSLFRVNPTSGKIDNLNAKEDYVMSFSLSNGSNDMVYVGQGAVNSDRLYSLNTKNLRQNLIEDLSAERLDGVMLGECKPWIYKSSRGDSICGRYILPPDFDPTRKYPMIVNYYGGCSPTSRTFESRYPHHVYAAHGYVVLVINPSGSAGFGQEFASRHVNTAGEGVAEDIIEGVRQFIKANPWVDASKIGCIGASYGGFMTQYLQTKTDLFAAAISHAGISDHTSYWGEGYWGYSYSEVSMAKSYPWSHSDLYVKQSPLYNADKIHTPILFLHGDSDTNVPFGESIQMYTALKLLGRETAFVAVRDANHQVTEFNKRKQWQETIFAWFAKYLQDDESWWESLYPKKILD